MTGYTNKRKRKTGSAPTDLETGQTKRKQKSAPHSTTDLNIESTQQTADKKQKTRQAEPETKPRSEVAVNIGAHVSAAGGVHKAVENAVKLGANAFALFLKSQRKWENPPMKEEAIEQFKTHAYGDQVVPHGSYLVNLAAKDKGKAAQAYTAFLDDLQRCERLDVKLYNFHPGNTNGEPRPEAIERIASQLNTAHEATTRVVTLLENMASSGNTIGTTFEDLRDIIALVHDKSRVGVCFDTCHGFAAGYDLRTPEAFQSTFALFDKIIGPQYLRAVHVNDSKAPFKSHRDLHYNIGYGFLGLRAFHNLVNDKRFHNLPLILETPEGQWAEEIKLLESLLGMDDETLSKLSAELSAKGVEERQRLQVQHDKKCTR